MDLIYRYDPFAPLTIRAPKTAEAAIEELQAGNRRFSEMVNWMHQCTEGPISSDPLIVAASPFSRGLPIVPGIAPAQMPFALVVNCSDARVATESVFDQSFNDLFVVRVAGNVLGTELLGSIDFAVNNLKSLRLALVLGHSECGAVSAAVSAYLEPAAYVDMSLSYPLRSLVDRLQIAVRGSDKALKEVHGDKVSKRSGYREALRDMSVYMNAAVTACDLSREMKQQPNGGLDVVYAVYDIATVQVSANPGEPQGELCTFAPAPTSSTEFAEIGRRWAEATPIVNTLGK